MTVFLVCGLLATAAPPDRPLTGSAVDRFAAVDKTLLAFMDRIDCSAATAAVSKGGELLYTRGYGWKDEEKKKPTQPDTLMRIASVTKPFTAAAVRASVRAGHLSLDDRAFDRVKIEPAGEKRGDPRTADITVGQLLAHKGGWDRDQSFDPMFRIADVRKTLHLARPPGPKDVIAYTLARPLDFAPGERVAYSNFGYCVLGRVLEAAEKEPTYFDALTALVLKPAGIEDVKLGATAKRHPREVWYPVPDDSFRLEVMDAHGGLIASAPAVCRFLDRYWISGQPRGRGRQDWTFFGSLPGTTAMARQRADGVNAVVLLNGRRDKTNNVDNEALQKSIDAALDAAFKE